MIKKQTISAAMYEAVRIAVTTVPPDVRLFLERALAEETQPLARRHLETTFKNFEFAASGRGLVCADTGFPLFFVKAGGAAIIEGGFGSLRECAEEAVKKATSGNFLRPTMVNPLTRGNPGTNIGKNMPKVELEFEGEGDGIDVVAVPKGGGSEIFGTFFRMLFPADGEAGIIKFVIESVYEGCRAGKICPPAIIGVGIGGTADLCMRLAKEAAVLRPLGARNPEPAIAVMEDSLIDAVRRLGLGPMGVLGKNAVAGLHISAAATHTAALPVAVNSQCLIGRRWKAVITGNNNVSFTGDVNDWARC